MDCHDWQVYMARCAANGEFIVTCEGEQENYFKVWNPETLELIEKVDLDCDGEYSDEPICCVAISPTSTTIAAGDQNGNVFIFEKKMGWWKCKKRWNGAAGILFALVFSPSNAMLALGGSFGAIKLYDVGGDYSLMHTLERHTDLLNPDTLPGGTGCWGMQSGIEHMDEGSPYV